MASITYGNAWTSWCASATSNTVSTSTPNATWQVWNGSGWVSSSSSTWGAWCSNAGVITNSNTTVTVWVRWNVTSNTPATILQNTPTASHHREPTPEEREAALRAREEEARRRLEEAKKREEAVKRAESLLRMFLTEEQLAEFERNKCFHVTAPSGTQYEIGGGSQHGNVVELDANGKKIRRYCIQPAGGLPNPDAWLSQKLMLETDEEAFKRIANMTQLAA